MENQKELTKEELEMYTRAILENKIYTKDLLTEILPLIEECIIADYQLTEEELMLFMLNGQKFKITVTELL